jgi:hypothetical protein
MPYIDQDDRLRLEQELKEGYPTAKTPGELQYLFAVLIHKYLKEKPRRYQTYNDIMGALSGASMEFYRQVVAPFEDGKKDANGGVY